MLVLNQKTDTAGWRSVSEACSSPRCRGLAVGRETESQLNEFYFTFNKAGW